MPGQAATFTVNAWDERDFDAACPSGPGCDSWESATGQGYDGSCDAWNPTTGDDCTLRDAVAASNANGLDDIILIPVTPLQPAFPGHYPLVRTDAANLATEDDNDWGDLDAWDTEAGHTLTLRGWSGTAPASVVVKAEWKNRVAGSCVCGCGSLTNFPDRILHGVTTGGSAPGGGVKQAVDLKLDHLELVQGEAVDPWTSAPGGGCVAQMEGDLTVLDSFFGSCSASSACATSLVGGGALHVVGDLYMERAEVSQNASVGHPGGGVWASGAVSIIESELTGNSTLGAGVLADGGGLYVSGSTDIDLEHSTFSANLARDGGGAYLDADDVDVVDCWFYGNEGRRGGGAEILGFDAVGSDPVVERSTFEYNEAAMTGGGLSLIGHPTTAGYDHVVQNCTFYDNYIGDGTVALGSPPFNRGAAIAVLDTGSSYPIDVDVVQGTIGGNVVLLAGPTTEYRSIFYDQAGGTLTLQNTILAGDCESPAGTMVSAGENVYWDSTRPSLFACPTLGIDVVGTESGGDADPVSGTTVPYGSVWSPHLSNTPFKTATGWSAVDFENKTCLGDRSQNNVLRPSTGATCDAGSFQP